MTSTATRGPPRASAAAGVEEAAALGRARGRAFVGDTQRPAERRPASRVQRTTASTSARRARAARLGRHPHRDSGARAPDRRSDTATAIPTGAPSRSANSSAMPGCDGDGLPARVIPRPRLGERLAEGSGGRQRAESKLPPRAHSPGGTGVPRHPRSTWSAVHRRPLRPARATGLSSPSGRQDRRALARSSFSARRVLALLRRRRDRALDLAAAQQRVDVVAVERLVLEQRLGDLLELLAVLGQDRHGALVLLHHDARGSRRRYAARCPR